MTKFFRLSIVSLVLILAFVWLHCATGQTSDGSPNFTSANSRYVWSFPKDHGAHPEFQTEWWYYTGQLYAKDKLPFHDRPEYGFQLTFFRRAERNGDVTSQYYLAHSVLTDVEGQRCLFSSRRADSLLGVGYAANDKLDVGLGNWSAEQITDTHVLRSSGMGAEGWTLRLLGLAPRFPLLQGNGGFSKKGECESCASQYYSIPLLPLRGEVTRSNKRSEVQGLGWMDHEFMSNSLSSDQQGWDWMALMFRDGTQLTIYQVRGKTPSANFFRGGLVRGEDSRELLPGDFTLTPLERWASESSKAIYPISWKVEVPSAAISVVVKARVPACEIGKEEKDEPASELPIYWEGPVASNDEGVIGYLEMTGYAGKIVL